MTGRETEALIFATNNLKNFLKLGTYSWFGAVSLTLVQELNISLGPHQVDYGNVPTLAGLSTCIPQKYTAHLVNAAALHFEGYMLAKLVLSDLILGGAVLPEELRNFTSLILLDAINPPKPPKQSVRNLPSHKLFLQRFAIWHTLAALNNQFALAPTNNGSLGNKPAMLNRSRRVTGAEIVESALSAILSEQASKNQWRATVIGIKAINAIWSERKIYENLDSEVALELNNCTSIFAK